MNANSWLRRWSIVVGAALLLCWFPCGAQEPATLSAVARTGNQFQFTLVGRPGARYAIEFSTNLLIWVPLTTNYEASAARTIVAFAPGGAGFYRVADVGQPYFQFALAASDRIQSSSASLSVDSFDSTDPQASTDGRYDPAKARDRADVVCLSGWPDSLNLSNAQIAGTVQSVPGGTMRLGPQGAVGSKAWLAANTGIEPGHFMTNLALSLPSVSVPSNVGFTPTGGWITNVTSTNTVAIWYDYVLDDGNYSLFSLYGSVYVRGRARLYVGSSLELTCVTIATNQSLDLYCAASSARFVGEVDGPASSFRFWGLPACLTVSFGSAGSFRGAIYAPNAEVFFRFGGLQGLEYSGALVARAIWFDARVNFHFDESLIMTGPAY